MPPDVRPGPDDRARCANACGRSSYGHQRNGERWRRQTWILVARRLMTATAPTAMATPWASMATVGTSLGALLQKRVTIMPAPAAASTAHARAKARLNQKLNCRRKVAHQL